MFNMFLIINLLLTKIPGGWLSFKFGGRIVLCASMFLGSLMTISLPFFARISPNALFAGLFVTGAAHVNILRT